MSTLLQDTFADANGTNVSSHTMNTGSGWTLHNGTAQIQGNAYLEQSSGTVNYIASADAGAADVTITLDVSLGGSVSTMAAGITGRVQDENNAWVFGAENDGAGFYFFILERNAGSNTLRASVNANNSGAIANAPNTLTATLSGASIGLSAGSGESCSYGSASFNQTKTRHGVVNFVGAGYAAKSMDNFLVTGTGGGGGGIVYTQLEREVRGLVRGVYGGSV